MVTHHLLHGFDQRCHQQTSHTTIEFSVGITRIVALAETEIESGVSQGVEQASQHRTVVGKDIAVMQGHGNGRIW